MSNTPNSTISPQLAVLGTADLTTVSASTTRGPIALANGAASPMYGVSVPLNPTDAITTADTKISKVALKGNSTSITTANVATTIGIWVLDVVAQKFFLKKEITVTAVTPSTTTPSFEKEVLYDDLVVPIGSRVYVTSTVANPLLNVALHGASM